MSLELKNGTSVPKPQKTKTTPRPHFEIGMLVHVDDWFAGKKRSWDGIARTLKWSNVSGWWFEVVNDKTGLTWQVPSKFVKQKEARRAGSNRVRQSQSTGRTTSKPRRGGDSVL